MLKEIKILTLLAVCGLASTQRTQLYGNPDGIVFPAEINSRSSLSKKSATPLSVQLAKSINSINSVEEFLNLIKGVPKEQHDILIASRFGEEERSNAIIPTRAACMPELQPVPFHREDTSIVYYPSCTRIHRCGGCCDHPLLSCQPTASITKNFKVIVSKVESDGELSYEGKQIVPLEEHTACECDCTMKPEHCTGKQVYVKKECICKCSNTDEEEKCRRSNLDKLWDPVLCACLCREERDCSSGFYFDPITCRCQQQRWLSNQRPSGYEVSDTTKSRDPSRPFIVPLGADNRRRQNKDDPEYKK